MPQKKSSARKPAAKRPLTPNQRFAIEKRQADRACRELLDSLQRRLYDETHVPANYRATVACALNVILHSGHQFVLACAKAEIAHNSLSLGDHRLDLSQFIDEQNTLFVSQMALDERTGEHMLQRWNSPDYHLPADTGTRREARRRTDVS